MTSKRQFDGERVKLGDCLLRSFSGEWGKAEGDTLIPVLRTANFNDDGTFDYSTPAMRCIPESKIEKKRLQRGDVVLEKSGGTPNRPVGILAYYDSDDLALCSNFNHVLRFDVTKIDSRFAFYQLRWLKAHGAFEPCTRKTTGLQNLQMSSFASLELKALSLGTQAECSNSLHAIETQIRGIKRGIAMLDTLVKSRFVEMFGDPIGNSKNLDAEKGRTLFKLGNGKNVPTANRLREGVPAYGGNGISYYTSESLYEGKTIVIGRVGRHCGNARYVDAPLWVTDNAMYIKSIDDKKILFPFLIEQMNLIGFNRYADEGDLWKITQQPFMEFEFLVPPLPLQRQFADFVAKVDKPRFVGFDEASHMVSRLFASQRMFLCLLAAESPLAFPCVQAIPFGFLEARSVTRRPVSRKGSKNLCEIFRGRKSRKARAYGFAHGPLRAAGRRATPEPQGSPKGEAWDLRRKP